VYPFKIKCLSENIDMDIYSNRSIHCICFPNATANVCCNAENVKNATLWMKYLTGIRIFSMLFNVTCIVCSPEIIISYLPSTSDVLKWKQTSEPSSQSRTLSHKSCCGKRHLFACRLHWKPGPVGHSSSSTHPLHLLRSHNVEREMQEPFLHR